MLFSQFCSELGSATFILDDLSIPLYNLCCEYGIMDQFAYIGVGVVVIEIGSLVLGMDTNRVKGKGKGKGKAISKNKQGFTPALDSSTKKDDKKRRPTVDMTCCTTTMMNNMTNDKSDKIDETEKIQTFDGKDASGTNLTNMLSSSINYITNGCSLKRFSSVTDGIARNTWGGVELKDTPAIRRVRQANGAFVISSENLHGT